MTPGDHLDELQFVYVLRLCALRMISRLQGVQQLPSRANRFTNSAGGPRLHADFYPGDIVVMDNLLSHKITGGVEAIESIRAEVQYLLPYSRNFNLIECAFSKFKKLLRDRAEQTNNMLWNTN